MEVYRTFTTPRFKVVCGAEPDHDVDLSWDDTGETAENLNSGLWQCFVAYVVVYCDGREIARDALGGCIYENPADFFTEHMGINGTGCGAYISDMVRIACADARAYIRNARALPYVRESVA